MRWIRLDNVPVMGRLVVINAREGLASNYNCGFCVCPPNFTQLTVDPSGVTALPGDTTQFHCTAQYVDCNNVISYTNPQAFWSSTFTTVATVSSTGLATAVGGGSACINASFDDNVYNFDGFYCSPTTVTRTACGQCDVVTVSVSCSPLDLALGPTAPSATTTGNCNATVTPAGGSFSWSVNTATVTLSSAGGGATITSANPSASQGDTVVSVTYTSGGRSATAQSAGITVHKPTALLVKSDSTNPSGKSCTVPCLANPGNGTCNASTSNCNYSSYLRTRQYSVVDQFNPPNEFQKVGISQATVVETIPTTTTCPGLSPPTPGNANTPVFGDAFWLCHMCCLPGGTGVCTQQTNPNQTLSVNGITVRTVTVNWSCTGVTLNP